MQGLRELFGAYGANYQNRMGHLLGNEKTRLKFLELFFEDLSVEKLGNALPCGDSTSAFEDAHTLKGAWSTMGRMPLNEAYCAIAKPLHQVIQADCQRTRGLWETWKGGETA